MTFLTGVQTLFYEARLQGSPPSTVTGQSGRAGDLVRWYAQAWDDIQRDRDGKWKWLYANFQLPVASPNYAYAFGSANDIGDNGSSNGFITRFRRWDLDPNNPPLIYKNTDGIAAQAQLSISEWTALRRTFLIGTQPTAPPTYVTEDPHGRIMFAPSPDTSYTVTGGYWKSNQELSVDADVPELPADYHMLIVYRALVKYGFDQVSSEILSRAQSEGEALYNALVENQGWSRFRIRLADTLA